MALLLWEVDPQVRFGGHTGVYHRMTISVHEAKVAAKGQLEEAPDPAQNAMMTKKMGPCGFAHAQQQVLFPGTA